MNDKRIYCGNTSYFDGGIMLTKLICFNQAFRSHYTYGWYVNIAFITILFNYFNIISFHADVSVKAEVSSTARITEQTL